MERYGSIESVLRAEIVEHQQANDALQRALDAEREKVAKLEKIQAIDLKNNNEYREQLATLQAQLAEIEQILCIESGKTTVDKVRDLHQSFKQVWNSYQGAGNDLFDMQAQLRQVEGENRRLKEAAQQARQEARQSISRLFDENQSGTPEYYCALLDAGNELDRLAREGGEVNG